jgi:hypothetical protein
LDFLKAYFPDFAFAIIIGFNAIASVMIMTGRLFKDDDLLEITLVTRGQFH